MAVCAKCGATLNEGAGFCGSCGTPVGAAVGGGPAPPAPVVASTVTGGMTSNMAALLTYLPFVGWIIAIVFLVAEQYKNDKFLRFHSFQSVFYTVAWIAIWIVFWILSAILAFVTLGLAGFVLVPLGLLLLLAWFAYSIFLMYKAYNNEKYMVPVIGKVAAQQAG